MSIRQTISRYILENLLFTDDESILQDDDSFLAMGIIDSLNAMEITYFIEETFSIKVREDEMLPENLDSVDRLVAFIECKRALPSLGYSSKDSLVTDSFTIIPTTMPITGQVAA